MLEQRPGEWRDAFAYPDRRPIGAGDDHDVSAGAAQFDRRRQPGRAGAEDHDIG